MGMCVREKDHRVEMWKLQLKQSLSKNLISISKIQQKN